MSFGKAGLMSDPIVSPADLAVFLGLESIDEDRAAMLLDDAQDLCESILIPLPPAAAGIVRRVAARGYTNITSAHSAGVGSANVSYGSQNSTMGVGGMYLSRSDKTDLRRLAGGGGAFSIDLLPKGVDQVVALTVTATAGSYLLGLQGVSTGAIQWNSPLLTVQAVLQAQPLIGAGNLTVTGVVGAYLLSFTGRLSTTPVPAFTVDDSALTGTAAVAVVTGGSFRPGQDMPWWDWTT